MRCESLGWQLAQRLGVPVTDQEEFDKTYISSTEICHILDVSRATIVTARKRGKLPEPICVQRPGGSEQGQAQILLWKRARLEPIIADWRLELASWRAARA
jgi:hypothetical protein